ncbi:unnamed protein product [Lymnaea stagnalis]|uniref:Uncharacterized protein n=1 Tax=Lymnaea stagnalis TaxID=6523 RepID=A0AAV2HBI9_LYMST
MAETDQLFTLTEQSPFVSYSPSIFQTKYGISRLGIGRAKRVGPGRPPKPGKATAAYPAPQKKVRLSPDTVKSEAYQAGKKDGVHECKDDDVVVKSEPPDDLEDLSLKGHKESSSVGISDTKPLSHRDKTSDPKHPSPTSSSGFVGKSSPSESEPQCTSPGSCGSDPLPDSSTGSCEQLIRDGRRRNSVSCGDDMTSSTHHSATTSSGETILCQVCGDLAAGFYCGAYICEACKKFFIRASKLERPRYVCLRQKDCVITKESRVHCQYCRYQKCLQLNMYYPKDGQKNSNKVGVQEIPCRVCSAPSSGFHFGALTCEGCKGFFRRMVKEREAYTYKCSKHGTCEVNAMTRNMCKACRYNKCLQIGMSVEGSRIGRQPNAVKHAISLEAKKQAALKTEPGTPCSRMDTSPTSFSFETVVLDPCMPGDVEDSLQSLDHESHVSKHEAEESVTKQEYSSPHMADKNFSGGLGSPSTTTTHAQSDRFRMPPHLPPVMPERYSRDPYSPKHNAGSSSFRLPGQPCVPDMYSQPQDHSIDLSISRHSSTSYSDNPCPSHPSDPPTPLSTSCPHPPPSSPCYTMPHLSHSSQHHPQHPSVSRCSSVDLETPHKHYFENKDRYIEGSQAYAREGYTQYGTYSDHSNTAISLRANYRDSTPSPQPRQTHIYQSNSGYSSNDYHQSNHVSQYHRPESEPPNHSQNVHGGMSYHHPRSQHDYSPPRERDDVYRRDLAEHYHERQSLDSYEAYNLSMSTRKHHSPPHYISSSQRREVAEFETCIDSQRPTKQSPGSNVGVVQTSYSPMASPALKPEPPATPQPVYNKETLQDQCGKYLSTRELSDLLAQAASNLFHVCCTERAKSSFVDEARFVSVDTCWEKMMEHFNFHAKCIVRFAKRVPGFRNIKIDDQVLMLRMATYSLVILIHSREYEPNTGFYNYFNFTKEELAKIKSLFPEFDILHSHFKHTGIMAKRLALTDIEYAYLSCMLLLDEEYPGLESVQSVKELKEKYMDAFHEYEIESFSNGSLRFGEMLLRLSEFSQFSMQHNISVGLAITKNSQLHIPQLYAEMYNSSMPDYLSD